MKIINTSIIFSLSVFLLMGCKKDPREIVLKSAMELSNINSIEYKNTIIEKKDAAATVKNRSAICYFDFTNNTPIMNASYHIRTDSTEIIYDDEKSVLINHQLKFTVVDNSPSKFTLMNNSFLTYSLHSMRNLLGRLIDNENVEMWTMNDTTINEIPCHQVKIQLNNFWIDQLDGLLQPMEGQFPVYYLMINKKTNIPVQFTLMQKMNESYYTSLYSDVKINTKETEELEYDPPTEFKAYPEFSLSEYRERLNNKAKISAYEEAPGFELESVDGDIIRLSDIKTPVYLFFFDPENESCKNLFNKISESSSLEENIQYLAIEITGETKENIRDFIDSNNIEIPVLINGKKTAKQYGVISTPAVFKIDSHGKLKFLGRNIKMEASDDSEAAELKTS